MTNEIKDFYNSIPENITQKDLLLKLQAHRNASNNEVSFIVSDYVLLLFIILYGTVSLLSIVGNAVVIFVVLRRNTMRTVTNVFIANLALADVSLGLFSVPFQFHTVILQRWVVADVMCKIAPFVKNLSVNVSILTLTVISIDRYIAVLYPLRAGFRRKIATCVLLGIWILSTLSAMPDLIYFYVSSTFDIDMMSEINVCLVKWPSKTFITVYSTYMLLLQYIVPLFVISVSYFRIVCNIWGNKPPGATIVREEHSRSLHRKKVVKMLITVTILFAVCWLPLQTYNLINAVYKPINRYKHINIIYLCANWLAMSNSCYNPFIYGLLNEKFKQEFRNLAKVCQKCKKKTSSNYVLYQSSVDNPNKTEQNYQSTDIHSNRNRCQRYYVNVEDLCDNNTNENVSIRILKPKTRCTSPTM